MPNVEIDPILDLCYSFCKLAEGPTDKELFPEMSPTYAVF